MAFGDKPFGLNQVKLVSFDETPVVVTLPVTMTLEFSPRMLGGELKGSDKIASVAAVIEALTWKLQEGGVPIDMLALMTGFEVSASGTTPNQVNTLVIDAGTAMRYFKIYGKALGEGIDDVHVKILKAKMTGNIEGSFTYGEFHTTGVSGIAVNDASGHLLEIVQNETAASLPSS